MPRQSVMLPQGYDVSRRTKEEGGGWVLTGGIKKSWRRLQPTKNSNRPSEAIWDKPAGARAVAAWTGDLPNWEIERLARLDYHARNALLEEERAESARAFTLAVTGEA